MHPIMDVARVNINNEITVILTIMAAAILLHLNVVKLL